jgi:hypothetical protein
MQCVQNKRSQKNQGVRRGSAATRLARWRDAGNGARMLRGLLMAGVAAILMKSVTAMAPSVSAAELAPIAVSLVVQETCEIRSSAAIQATASVTCLHGAARAIERSPVDPTQPLSTLESAAQPALAAVLTVAF